MQLSHFFPTLLLTASVALAQGDVIRQPVTGTGVRTTKLHVEVEIVDGVATTRLSQTIRNDTTIPQAEAIWILPLPEGAVADDFEMLVNGVAMRGEVLGADRARDVYETIVRRKRDPGLLEYVGRGCLRARVFPIPAGQEIGVEVSFRHILTHTGGLSRWSFPVRSAGVDGKPPERVTLDLSIASRRSIKNAFSPSAGVDVLQKDDFHVRASYEGVGSALPKDELAVMYGLSNADFGLNLLSHRAQGDGEGTFLMMISPKREWGEEVLVKKAITFVLDTSGSMAGEKIVQAQNSLRFFLASLRPEDRFNVVPFSTEARPFFGAPVPATAENVAKALERVKSVEAVGGTNIADALRAGLTASTENGEYVPLVVFLTDGLPTVGVTAPEEILRAVKSTNREEARIFVLGVGNDVNTLLLDSLAEKTRGTRDYVRPEEDIELVAGALLTKLTNPVLTDLALEIDGIRVTRLVPGELGDLFQGERLEIFGRYEGSGPTAIRLRGSVRGTRKEFVFEGAFAKVHAEFDFLPALWAERRVALLLDAIRLNGERAELVDEVKRIGREYHIVTPYTSHLILEEGFEIAQVDNRFRGPGDTLAPGEVRRLERLGYGGGGNAPSGPTSAGPASPGGRASGAPQSGSDGFFLGRGEGRADMDLIDLDQVVAGLRSNEVLAAEADDEAYEELAREVVLRVHGAKQELAKLGKTADSGEDAVARSRYLRDLASGDARSKRAAVSELLTRRVGKKLFRLRKGVWTDAEHDPAKHTEKTTVVAYSPEYFALIRDDPSLLPYLTLGERVLVVLGDRVLEILPPEKE